jgi:glycosyltransferase involved in cell wall biosynthesis
MSPLISFIVPIYNVEKYLKECIDSILNQNLSDYEIILVNDGSTDGSKDICEKYVQEHENINLITTENQGQSAARNLGIELAKGEYIAFIDSDDYYSINSLKNFEKLLMEYPSTDVIIGKVKMFFEGSNLVKPKLKYNNISNVNGMNGEDGLDYLINTSQFLQSVYSYIVKKELITKNNISFNPKYKAYEDLDFTLKVFIGAKEIRAVDLFFLMYRKNRIGQITYKGNLKRDESAINVAIDWINNIERLSVNNKTKENVKKYLANKYLLWIANQITYSGYEKEARYEALEKGSHIIKYSKSDKIYLKIAKCIQKYLGFKYTVLFLTKVQKIYNIRYSMKNKRYNQNETGSDI